MQISELLKKSSRHAKNREFNEAIETLDVAIPMMAAQGGFSKDNYVKIIPYFQKAGRYEEVAEYALQSIIPAIRRDYNKLFSSKCSEMAEAFTQLGVSATYDKLRLCAKREHRSSDERAFSRKSAHHLGLYKEKLEIAEKKELEKDFRDAKRI